ncbi:flavohemoglobin expression-modulating QEGLA motif protein [Nitrosophilus alvini]|uniref:flavohemoglobin expression-modulating QEGLA motif protein n=1 Tax=Nitrosophilus alvini TaxID=2714855 RepID=UPI001909C6C5|nr:flavohemoglobin expression-modulating QEGLA motif protein [Nitrosophilus alvini]
MKNQSDGLTAKHIDEICEKLRKNMLIRERLPGWGRIHIDRMLPFLALYRRPANRDDIGTKRLVYGEAAYIIAEESANSRLKLLIKKIADTVKEDCGAFLLVEIWSKPYNKNIEEFSEEEKRPEFTIYAPKLGVLTNSVESLKNKLSEISIHKLEAKVNIKYSKTISPPDIEPLFDKECSEQNRIFCIGLEVKPIYQDIEGKKLYPFELAKLHKGVSQALKKAFFTFSKEHTNTVPADYRALGRRAVTKIVKKTDEELAKIEDSFDFLLQATPVNIHDAWENFKKSGFEKEPVFYYRPRPFDPSIVKRELFSIPIEDIEDPTLFEIFSEKRDELDRKLTMLSDRGTKKFLYGSLQVYGRPDENLKESAKKIIEITKEHTTPKESKKIDAKRFAEYAKKEIEYYKNIYPDFKADIEIREDIVSSAMVSSEKFLIYKWATFPEHRIEALLNHEIGTHILTFFNGLSQPFKQLHTGLCGYDEMQEGLAVLSEYLCDGLTIQRLKILAARVLAVDAMVEGADFIETFRFLINSANLSHKSAFSVTTRVFRGGGLTKDAVYLRGFLEILNYIKEDGKIKPLYAGKIAAKHIPIIQELILRKVLHEPPLYPKYLDTPNAIKKIENLKKEKDILEIIKRDLQ